MKTDVGLSFWRAAGRFLPAWPAGRMKAGSPRSILSSSLFRLTLLYVALLASSMAILLGFVYWSTAGYMARQTDATINAEIRGLAEQYQRRGLSGLTAVIAERVRRDPAGASLYLLVDEGGKRLVGNLARWPTGDIGPGGWMDFNSGASGSGDSGQPGGGIAGRGKVFRLQGDSRLLVGRDVRELKALRDLMVDALWSGLLITAALALVGGWLISASIVHRLEAVNQVSREIMEGDLSRRVPTDGSADDFDQLAINLNRMLARIEQLMASVRQVSDNIAHDLRTPLTRLRAKLELLVQAGLPEPRRLEVEQAVSDAEELLSTFNALLRIARIESGHRRSGFARLDMAELLRDLGELYEPVAADREQILEIKAPDQLWLTGDRDLLFQACANLVENAMKYTPPAGLIEVSARADAMGVVVCVRDSGPGIPATLRDKVFDRFFRVDDSRSSPGSGLGLSLVQAIARLHHARVELTDNHPGLKATLVLGRVES